MGVVHRTEAQVKQHAKVTIGIGDWVVAVDHRSEFAGRTGKVVDITEWVEPDGYGRGACLRVKFFGPSVMGNRGGTESTGAQWFEYFGPASEDGYAWKGPWRAVRRNGAKPADGDKGDCWACGRKASWLQRHGTGHTTFACSKHVGFTSP